MDFHLAQLNIGRALAQPGSPQLEEFMAMLDPINAIADATPGFVWRLQDDAGNATSYRPYPDDDLLIVNFSVWESIDALADFVYKGEHVKVLRRRKEWFETFGKTYLVLWWTPAGTIPSIEEAKRRLDLLEANGPTPEAFTFKQRFPAPDPVAAS